MLKKVQNEFPKDIKFKFPWRKYQARVFEELQEHLNDNHLHIIAPPGSGKTILGLEVAIRLNKPTLIFAPTIAIRNQWINRFCDFFLQEASRPDWISNDIKNPKFLTVVTYQSLHAACTNRKENEQEDYNEVIGVDENIKSLSNKETIEIIALLKSQSIGTLVVDEAHHLKNAWWKSLTKIKRALNPTIVGLTATPPYDVSYVEWERYLDLNGPVDAEISVPELVLEGNLCPHQDYVLFSQPTVDESQKISEYRNRIENLYNEIKSDKVFINALIEHPVFQNPNLNLDWIYTNLECFSSILIFLNELEVPIPEGHLEVIGDKNFTIPKLSYQWMEILLTFYLYKDSENFINYLEHQEKLTNKLKRNGAMERRSISFMENHKIRQHVTSSLSKLESIKKIVDFEHRVLKEDLRMVILTDFIRKEYLIKQPENNLEITKIGVMPIFEKLRRTNINNLKIGVLTGSLIIIPKTALSSFATVCAKLFKIKPVVNPIPFDSDYLIVGMNNQIKSNLVHIITQIFQKGEIEVLIGTKSLLGEGWDAPSINALVLASFVGSYVLSNQMRGRAIRTQEKNNDKTGNIWHLVCLDNTMPNGGDDFELLKRRFKAFVGISLKEKASIENGIARLNLPEEMVTLDTILSVNKEMFSKAEQRDELKEEWRKALESGVVLREEIKIPFSRQQDYNKTKNLYYNRTIAYLAGMLTSGISSFSYEVLHIFKNVGRRFRTKEQFYYFLMFIGLAGFLVFGRLAFKTFRAYIKYRDISKDVQKIGEALLASLVQMELIHTNLSELNIVCEIDDLGAIYCRLEGGTTYEKSLFITALQAIIQAVNNPRYIIIRKSFFLKVISQKDYHSVPEVIGINKKFAEFFAKKWDGLVGNCDLIYTRTLEGRKLLLQSRIKSLASEFQDETERINKWR